MTAKEWRDKNPDAKGNIRDEATIEQCHTGHRFESQRSTKQKQVGFSFLCLTYFHKFSEVTHWIPEKDKNPNKEQKK